MAGKTDTPSDQEFSFEPKIGAGLRIFFYSQLFVTPEYPKHSFAGQTVIVTGSNVGLGLEAARHFYRLNCARLILAVRTPSKGEAAKEDIIRSVKSRSDAAAIEIWELDQSSTASTLAFANRVKAELPRVDAVVENAGVGPRAFKITDEGYEESAQINVLNTFLILLSLLPKLVETKEKFPSSAPHITVVTSEAHRLTKFAEINEPDLYARLNKEEHFQGPERYRVGKLLEILLVRELVARLAANKKAPGVIINLVNPGLCKSTIDRSGQQPPLGMRIMRRILDRTTEVGSRTFVIGASAPPSSHGEYMADGKNQEVESWILTDLGKKAQVKAFEQTMKVMEMRSPGIGASVGL